MVRILDEAIDLLKLQVNAWCRNMRHAIKDEADLEKAIEKICETANEFGASPSEMRGLLSFIEKNRIEAIIKSVRKEKRFKISRKCDLQDEIVAKWVLSKYNSDSELSIELCRGNYIHVRGNDWNLFAFGYSALESSIYCWAEGRM